MNRPAAILPGPYPDPSENGMAITCDSFLRSQRLMALLMTSSAVATLALLIAAYLFFSPVENDEVDEYLQPDFVTCVPIW
ncbi:MAG: hypothetical protein ACNA8W_15730 [Bradymonadaceae bacterium]